MIKKLFTAFAVLVVLGNTAYAVDTAPSDECDMRLIKGRGGDEPFPLGATLKMPWTELEGSWETVGALRFHFDIRVLRETEEGTKFVMVKFIDSETGEVKARGVGIVKRNERVLRAFLRGPETHVDLSISAHTLIATKEGCLAKRVLAVRMSLRKRYGAEELNRTMLLRKLDRQHR